MIRTSVQPAALSVHTAVEYLRAGEVVAFPTETVYGLGADARRGEAVRKIYEAKGRPSGNPLIVHVADEAGARACVKGWHGLAGKLNEAFWPGPLTMILERGAGISEMVSAGRSTVAVRCPRHPVAQALLRAFDGPIAAPSANRSGFTSPTTAGHVLAELAGRIPLIVDGGACEIGLESTVIDITGDVPTVLRPGAITLEMLREVIGEVRDVQATVVDVMESAASPGMHRRHYAPRTPAFRFERQEWPTVEKWVDAGGGGGRVGLLSCVDSIFLAAPAETIRMPWNAGEYAQAMYAALREMDQKKPAVILVLMPESTEGLWVAIADRLRRATEPFSVITDAGR